MWPEAVELALNFVYDLWKVPFQLPEYLYFESMYELAETELSKKEYLMKLKSRLDDNMVLGLVALLYDWLHDSTLNLMWFSISADHYWSRFKDLIHSIWTPDTWTPDWIKDVIVLLLPLIKLRSNSNIINSKLKDQISSSNGNLLWWEILETELTMHEEKPLTDDWWTWNADLSNSTNKEWAKPRTRKDSFWNAISISPQNYLDSYHEALTKIWDLMHWIKDWVLISSNAIYIKIPDYKILPDDFDLVVKDVDFANVYKSLKEAFSKWQIRDLKVISVNEAFTSNVIDPLIIQKLLENGNIKVVFSIDTSNGIPMEVEIYPEWNWKWYTQLWHIPRTVESFYLNWKEIKICWLLDLVDIYTINLINEIWNNSLSLFWLKKAKDWTRVHNLTYYLKEFWVSNPKDLIAKIDEVEKKYREHWKEDLSEWLSETFSKIPEVKETLTNIIKRYELMKRTYDLLPQTWKLPEFHDFIETWNKNKAELYKMYKDIISRKLTPEEKQSILTIIDSYEKEVNNIIMQSLEDEKFAYFYEMNIIQKEYINTIRELLLNN